MRAGHVYLSAYTMVVVISKPTAVFKSLRRRYSCTTKFTTIDSTTTGEHKRCLLEVAFAEMTKNIQVGTSVVLNNLVSKSILDFSTANFSRRILVTCFVFKQPLKQVT